MPTATAWVLQLTDGETTLDLLDVRGLESMPNGVHIPPPDRQIVYGNSRYVDGDVPAFDHHGNRRIPIALRVQGSTIDNLLDNLHAVHLMLERTTRFFTSGGASGAPCYYVQQVKGSSYAARWEVRAGAVDHGDFATVITTSALEMDVTATLECAPFSEETEDSIVTAATLNANGDSTLLTGRGEVPAPSKIVITDNVGSMRAAYLSFRNRGNPANFNPILEGETGAYTGYAVTDIAPAGLTYSSQAAVGTASNNAFGRWTKTLGDGALHSFWQAAITANVKDNYGRFKVIARLKCEASENRTLQVSYAASSMPVSTPVPFPTVTVALTTTWNLFELCTISFPGAGIPSNMAVSSLLVQLAGIFPNNGDTIDVDRVFLVPCGPEDGFFYITSTSTLTNVLHDKIVIDGTVTPHAIYITDAAGGIKGYLTQFITGRQGVFPKVFPGVSRLLFVGQYSGSAFTENVDIALTWKPRFNFGRGT